MANSVVHPPSSDELRDPQSGTFGVPTYDWQREQSTGAATPREQVPPPVRSGGREPPYCCTSTMRRAGFWSSVTR